MHTYRIVFHAMNGVSLSLGTVRARNVHEAIEKGWSLEVPMGMTGTMSAYR